MKNTASGDLIKPAALPQYFHCALCGFEFEKHSTACAQGCPLGRFCKLVRCPNCGYEFPENPEVITWIQRLFHRRRPPPPERDLVPMNELAEGQRAELVCWDGTPVSRRNALAVYGLVPGCDLVLEQKWPAIIIRIGETQLALEAGIAREIFVRPKIGTANDKIR